MSKQFAREKFITDVIMLLNERFSSLSNTKQLDIIDLLTPERFHRIKNGRNVTLADLHDFAVAVGATIKVSIE